MNGWGWFFLILFLILLGYGAWAGWHFYNAKRQGLPPPAMKSYIPFYGRKFNDQSSGGFPTPRASNPIEWIKDQLTKLRGGNRTHRGAYEGAGNAEQGTYAGLNAGAGGARRGRGMEDDAWDTRVGNEDPYGTGPGGYNEEAELGLAPTPGLTEPYGRGSDYLTQTTSYGGGQQQSRAGGDNPFGDEHAVGSRSVEGTSGSKHKRDNSSLGSGPESPNSVRKSYFQERI